MISPVPVPRTVETPAIYTSRKAGDTIVTGPGKSIAKNSLAVLDTVSDRLTIRAHIATPTILLVTDNYSRGWRARSLMPDLKHKYEILPANYTLMAIPLTVGEHLLRVEYRPRSFIIGTWVSTFAWVGFGGLLGFAWLRRRKKR